MCFSIVRPIFIFAIRLTPMPRRFFFLSFFFCLTVNSLLAQVSGRGTYQFLGLSTSARSTALGGKVVALDESDLSLAAQNPSLLDSSMHNGLSLSYVNYFTDINYVTFSYARNYSKVGTLAIGGQRIGYGSFYRADETGIQSGTFTASEMALSISYSRTIDTCFSVGISFKPIYSHLESYTSWGVAFDFAGSYRSQNGLFSAGLIFKNVGSMVKSYTPGTYEPIPFEIIAGISKKLAHAPFRFLITFQQLQNMSLYYKTDDFTEESVFDESENKSDGTMEKISKEIISHVILGAEFVPIRNFYLRFGYNYQRRNELKIQEKVSTVGFSFGFGVKISKFHINYSRAKYHLAGATNHFSVITDLDKLFHIK